MNGYINEATYKAALVLLNDERLYLRRRYLSADSLQGYYIVFGYDDTDVDFTEILEALQD